MALILTAANNAADPPTATATLTGTVGASVTVYGQPAAFDGEAPAWLALGTRIGDGTLVVALSKGFWWLYAATSTLLAPPVQVHATDGLDSVPTRCRRAIAAQIAALGLVDPVGGAAVPVYEQIYPDETGIDRFPCVILSVEGVQETDAGGVNAFDDKGYPTRVGIYNREGTPPDHTNLPTYEGWRYRIERAFDGDRLPGVPESAYCRVEPYVIADPQLPYYQHFVSGLLIRSICRVPRGLAV